MAMAKGKDRVTIDFVEMLVGTDKKKKKKEREEVKDSINVQDSMMTFGLGVPRHMRDMTIGDIYKGQG